MHTKNIWTTDYAAKFFECRALLHANDFVRRFNWEPTAENAVDGYSTDDLDAIYAEVVARIPGTTTRVLDVGCGDGRFGAVLRELRPGMGYRGIDLSPTNIATAQAAAPAEDFVIANAVEYLYSAAMDWDYVVSIGCLAHCTDTRDLPLIFRALNVKAPKGFLILADPAQLTPDFLTSVMPAVLSGSTGTVTSYYEGARGFLQAAVTKSLLHPVYVRRTNTAAASLPALRSRQQYVGRNDINRVLARFAAKNALRQSQDVPETFAGVDTSGNLVVSTNNSVSLIAEWSASVPIK